MSDHCVHSHRTYYLLHFNYRAASRTVIFEMGPSIDLLPGKGAFRMDKSNSPDSSKYGLAFLATDRKNAAL